MTRTQYAIVWLAHPNRPDLGDYRIVEWPPPTTTGDHTNHPHRATLIAGPYPTHQAAARHFLTAPGQPRPS